MNENFITRFEISNFKKFDHLVVENIGQVNLITGDNNVGKTSLLEALILEKDIRGIMSVLYQILHNRNLNFNIEKQNNFSDTNNNWKNNIIGLFQKNLKLPIVIKKKFSSNEDEIKIYNEIIDVINTDRMDIRNIAETLQKYSGVKTFSKNWLIAYLNGEIDKLIDVTSQQYNESFHSVPIIPFVGLSSFFSTDIIDIYSTYITNKSEKENFISLLNNIFSIQITDIQPGTFHDREQLNITTESNDQYHSITQYGDGFIRLVRIILTIKAFSNRKLMIDEVETGVHYLKIKEQWKTIFQLSLQNNVQIFTTTHSLDCIKAFVEASEENKDWQGKIRLIELKEANVKNISKVYASTFKFEQIETGINSEYDMRGGRIYGKY